MSLVDPTNFRLFICFSKDALSEGVIGAFEALALIGSMLMLFRGSVSQLDSSCQTRLKEAIFNEVTRGNFENTVKPLYFIGFPYTNLTFVIGAGFRASQ
jgi:hypothetical protein